MFTVLLNWTVVSWPQPVAVLQDLEPGLTDPLIFQKKPGCYTSVQGPLSCGKESSRVTRPRRRGREHRPPAGLPPPWPHHLHKGLEASQLARAERGCRSSGLQACVWPGRGVELCSGPACLGSDPRGHQVTAWAATLWVCLCARVLWV